MLQHFHIARVRRVTVQGFRRKRHFAKLSSDISIIEVRHAVTDRGIRQEEIPETSLFSFVLGAFEKFKLARVKAPAVFERAAEFFILFLDRLHVLFDVFLHGLKQRNGCFRHFEVIHLQAWVNKAAHRYLRILTENLAAQAP